MSASGLVEAAVYAPADGRVRRWRCPRCWVKLDVVEPPAGWVVFRPFDRVAACDACRADLITDFIAEGIL